MSGLLVSVRNAEEAAVALAAGVDVIDVKEPSRGPLGAANGEVIDQVVRLVAGRVPVSAALGELRQFDEDRCDAPRIDGLSYVKLGLSDCRSIPDWPARWRRAVDSCSRGVHAVAVVYADWDACSAPAPRDVLDHAAQLGCRAALLDTFDKSLGRLPQLWELGEIAGWIRQAHEHGMMAVVAGSLRRQDLPGTWELGADLAAVRGAACQGSARDAPLDRHRVEQLVKTGAPFANSPPADCIEADRLE